MYNGQFGNHAGASVFVVVDTLNIPFSAFATGGLWSAGAGYGAAGGSSYGTTNSDGGGGGYANGGGGGTYTEGGGGPGTLFIYANNIITSDYTGVVI